MRVIARAASTTALTGTGTPTSRSSATRPSTAVSTRVASPGPRAGAEPGPRQLDVALVLEQHRQVPQQRLAVDLRDAEQEQRPRPVDRLRHRGPLLEVQLPEAGDRGRHLPG